MKWKVTDPPSDQPVTLEAAKAHLRIEPGFEGEDAEIAALIEAATGWAEQHLNLAIMEQTITAQTDLFPDGRDIYLPQSNLLEVVEVTYRAPSGDREEFTGFVENRFSQPGILRLQKGVEWPRQGEDVQIEYRAGFKEVPASIKQAILLMLSHWYHHRETVNVGSIVQEVPLSAVALLDQYRVMGV